MSGNGPSNFNGNEAKGVAIKISRIFIGIHNIRIRYYAECIK